MANMSYCMCENTAKDLHQVISDLDFNEDTSKHEILGALRLIVYCSDFLLDHAESIIDFAKNADKAQGTFHYSRAINSAVSALESIEDYAR